MKNMHCIILFEDNNLKVIIIELRLSIEFLLYECKSAAAPYYYYQITSSLLLAYAFITHQLILNCVWEK